MIQLQAFLSLNHIYETFQSGFRKLCSTESALLKILNVILDAGSAVALIVLDLSTAFDLVDHSVLTSRLKNCVGLRGTILEWFRSFLTNRKISVRTGQNTSSTAPLTFGVPQGSIITLTLFYDVYTATGFSFSGIWDSFPLIC